MPAEVCQPLGVAFTLPGGVAYHRRLHDLPNPALAADLAEGLVAATHPHGPIRTRSVAGQYVQTARRMVRELHAEGFTGGIAALTPAVVVQYWLTCDFHRERRIRVILGAYDRVADGVHPGIRRHLEGRRINTIQPSQPYRPYSDGEWQRLAAACTETISTSHRAHRQAVEAAARGADPAVAGAGGDNLAWLLRRTGPVPVGDVLGMLGPGGQATALREEVAALRRAFYPDVGTAFAYLTLFAMRTGIVPDGVDRLTVGDITRTGEATVLLSYVKGRTGRESLNLPRDAVRLLDRWLAHSAPLREHAAEAADQLWIYAALDGRGLGEAGPVLTRPRTQRQRKAWVQATGVVGDDGQPLAIHGGRVRATYHHRRDRSNWTGRTTIDPNHSAQVEGDHYLSAPTPAQRDALDGIIEQAQADLRRKAEAAPPVALSGEDAAAFAADFPRLAAEAGADVAAAQALLSGEQDVFVAACAAPWEGPHAPAGTLCPARPWVCLLCPLAAFAPRHLPNLLRLKEFFARQATRMTTAQFLGVFGPYACRLDEEILPRFAPAAVAAARHAVDTGGGLPLHLEELPL